MIQYPWRWFGLIAALCCTLGAGCGGGGGTQGITVKGRLVNGGQNAVPEGGYKEGSRYFAVQLFSVDASGKPTAGSGDREVKEDGTFELDNVTPGKYRVAVFFKNELDIDRWGNKFGPDTTPLTCEVKPGEELKIDIKDAKPTGTPPKT